MLEQYFELREVFLERYGELNLKEQKILLISLLNDTTLLIRKRLIDITESLPIYKIGLKSKILLTKGVLTYIFYAIIISSSNIKNDFDYTNQFIKSYTQKLDRKFQKDGLNWAMAHTVYYKKGYNKSLDILFNYNFKTLYFQSITKILTTQIYFDLYIEDDSYHSLLLNYIDSFEKWILREKLKAKFNKKSFLRFTQKCRILVKHNENISFQHKKVEDLLVREENIQAANWLNRKICEIINLRNRRPFQI